MRPTRSPFIPLQQFVSIRAIRGQKNSFPIAPAKDNFKLSQVVPVVVISSPHCISANSCDRPGRHLIHCNYSCQFVQFVGKKNPNNSWAIIIRGISVAPAKDNFKLSQVVPVVVISSPHCISANSCDRPGRHLIHCNYSCQFVQFVGKKNISQ